MHRMKANNISKRWQVEVCESERTHAQNMHINIDNTINGGENTRSGENTHTFYCAMLAQSAVMRQ